MDYDAIAHHFLTPGETVVSIPEVPQTPARMVRDAVEAIATIGWWSREAADGFTKLGHGFFDGYVWGRAAALGSDVSPAVVTAAFGAFNGQLLGPVYQQGKAISSVEAILQARSEGASRGLGNAAAGVDTAVVSELGDRLVNATLATSPGSRPLFGALQALPVPTDPYGRLWRGAELFREHRGDGHLAACAVSGLDVVEMNVLTEVWLGYSVGEYSASRGFGAEEISAGVSRLVERGWMDATTGAVTSEGRVARNRIESLTDDSQAALMALLGDTDEVQTVIDQASLITKAILASRAAPADPRKRYAG